MAGEAKTKVKAKTKAAPKAKAKTAKATSGSEAAAATVVGLAAVGTAAAASSKAKAKPAAAKAKPAATKAPASKPAEKKPATAKPATSKATTSKVSTAKAVAAQSGATAPSKAPAKATPKATPNARAAKKDNAPPKMRKPAKPDDLKLISGVGPKLESVLNGLGVYKFEQVAKWKKAECDWVDDHLKFKGRIERDDWVKQAKALAKGGAEEYIRVFGKNRASHARPGHVTAPGRPPCRLNLDCETPIPRLLRAGCRPVPTRNPLRNSCPVPAYSG